MPGAGRVAVVELLGGQRGELEERRAGVAEPLDAVAHEQLAARDVALAGALAAAGAHAREARLEVGDEREVAVAVRRGGSALDALLRPRRSASAAVEARRAS